MSGPPAVLLAPPAAAGAGATVDAGAALAVALYGGVVYCLTFLSFVLVRRYRVREKGTAWSPLSVVLCGWTQVAAIGGCMWYLQGLAATAPPGVQDVLFPPTHVVCWLRLVWDAVGVMLFTGAVCVKQYRYYSLYVSDTRPKEWSWRAVFACVCLPYLATAGVAYWMCYDEARGACSAAGAVQTALFSIALLMLLGVAGLVYCLRDPCQHFPNFATSVVETAGLFALVALRGIRLWSPWGASPALALAEVLARATIPPALYAVAVGRVLWKLDDAAYRDWLESLCEPGCHHHLLTTPPKGSDVETAGQGSVASGEARPRPIGAESFADARSSFSGSCEARTKAATLASCASPDYTRAKQGDYFEADRLTKLLNAGDRDAVQEFVLTTNLYLLHTQDREGLAPIHRAAKQGHMHLMRFLLDMSCDPNLLSKESDCALHYAAHQGNVAMMKLLLDAGAKPNVVSQRGCTPLHCAVSAGSIAAVTLLMEHNADPLLPAEEALGDAQLAEDAHVVERGRMRQHFKNAFTLAVELGAEEAVGLMARPRCVRAYCVHGMTPLLIAVANGNKGVVKTLLSNGAEAVHMNPYERRNVFHYAAVKGSRGMYQILRAALSDAEEKRRTGSPDTRSRSPDSADEETTTWDSNDLSNSPTAHETLPPEAPQDAGERRETFARACEGGGPTDHPPLYEEHVGRETGVGAGRDSAPDPAVYGNHTRCISDAFTEHLRQAFADDTDECASGKPAVDCGQRIHHRDPPAVAAAALHRKSLSLDRSETASDGGWCAVDLLSTLLSSQDYMGRTPLHIATLNRNFEMALSFLEDGCDASLADSHVPGLGAMQWTARRYLYAMSSIPYERWDQYQRLLRVLKQSEEQRWA